MKGLQHLLRTGIWGLALSSAFATSVALAVPDNWEVEGAHGEIYVSGTFTEGACHLDMASEMQQVSLGDIPSSLLRHPGDRGLPTTFTLKFHDCIRSGGNTIDPRTGNTVWDPIQPVVDITFVAPADEDNPQLIKVSGVTGMGLRLTDSSQKTLRLGESVSPHFMTPYRDELTYYVQPERNAQPLTAGHWRATVDFRLNYN